MMNPTPLELTGMLVVRTNERGTTFSVRGSDGRSVLLSDPKSTIPSDVKFFRNATIKISIEFDETNEFVPTDH